MNPTAQTDVFLGVAVTLMYIHTPGGRTEPTILTWYSLGAGENGADVRGMKCRTFPPSAILPHDFFPSWVLPMGDIFQGRVRGVRQSNTHTVYQ